VNRLSLAGAWGIIGVVALLGQAIWKLTPMAIDAIRGGLDGAHVAVLVAWVAFSIYAEGYRAFQLQFSPRVVARARHLSANPRPLHVALAPAYCMGLLHATRKRLIVSWIVTLAIVGIVIVVRRLDQPWRGIVDAGVVVALVWGVVAIAVYTLRRGPLPVATDVP
jgi:hypothetical protein